MDKFLWIACFPTFYVDIFPWILRESEKSAKINLKVIQNLLQWSNITEEIRPGQTTPSIKSWRLFTTPCLIFGFLIHVERYEGWIAWGYCQNRPLWYLVPFVVAKYWNQNTKRDLVCHLFFYIKNALILVENLYFSTKKKCQ